MSGAPGAPAAMRLPGLTLAFGVLLVCSGALYLYDLGRMPAYLSLDEAHFGVHAYALAESGRNLDGDWLPLFVSLADPLGDQPTLWWGTTWYQPVLFYLIAFALKIGALSEATIRMPTAVIGGLVNVTLIYAVAYRLMKDRWCGIMAALLLALSPAHVIVSRQALDYICPVPFVLGWLWCLVRSVETGRARYALAGGALLGAGCYAYVTSWMMMPFYLVLSWALCWRTQPRALRMTAAAVCGFAIPLVLLVPWVWRHPEMPLQLWNQYQVTDSSSVSVFEAIGRGLGFEAAARVGLGTYWDYFNPSFLFVRGAGSQSMSTGDVGVFLLPLAAWLPAGLYVLWQRRDVDRFNLLLLACLLSAPVPVALKGASFAVQRVTTLLPFVVLVSVAGWSMCRRSRHRVARVAAALLLAAVPLQFAGFYRDYLTDYRVRSATRTDPTAFRDTAEYLLAEEAAGGIPAFFLMAPMYDVSAKWRFYATKAGRQDLLSRTRYFTGDPAGLERIGAGSLMVIEHDRAKLDALVQEGDWSVARIVIAIGGRPALAVLRRVRDG